MRDEEVCGRERDVKTSIEKKCCILNEDRHVSIKIKSIGWYRIVGIANAHRIIYESKFCTKFVNTMNYMTEVGIKTVLPPLYSPDLAPCNPFYCFPS